MEKFIQLLNNNQTIIIALLIISIIGGSYFKGKREIPNKTTTSFLTGISVMTLLYFAFILFLK